MKRKICLALIFVLALMFVTGCSDNSKSESTEDNKTAYSEEDPYAEEEKAIDSSLGLDLTTFEFQDAYDIAQGVIANPKKYEGTTIKMGGYYEAATSEGTKEVIHAVVWDGDDSCCDPSFEFVLKDGYKYPDDYPKPNEKIEIEGVLKSFKQGDNVFYHLEDAELTLL